MSARIRSISKKTRPPVAITTGDHCGIGPEIIAKGIYHLRLPTKNFIIFGLPELYVKFRQLLPKTWKVWTEREVFSQDWMGPQSGHLNFIVPDSAAIDKAKQSAFLCGRYIELAAKGAMEKKFSALCTGPIDKNELRAGGYPYDGHTEFLKDVCKASSVAMMLANSKMRVSLATVHVPVAKISQHLKYEQILKCFENTITGLKLLFGIKKPRLAVLGLNPHSGDHGLFGTEEITIIRPAIEEARRRFHPLVFEGPFAPDGFFAQWSSRFSKKFDVIVCMYHDQGLIPVKMIDFKNTVNISLGLPIIRTSVDHGVARDLVGKNKADPSSFIAALKLAQIFVKGKKGRHGF